MSLDHFEQLRRDAFERGMADYQRAKDNTTPGCFVWKNNPHQNNHATDEKEHWSDGFDHAQQMDLEDNGTS